MEGGGIGSEEGRRLVVVIVVVEEQEFEVGLEEGFFPLPRVWTLVSLLGGEA